MLALVGRSRQKFHRFFSPTQRVGTNVGKTLTPHIKQHYTIVQTTCKFHKENKMTQILPDLFTCLHNCTWRKLLAILETHGLSASTRQRKDETVQRLLIHLPTTMPSIISHFAQSENDAIFALLNANGQLPAVRFQERFGAIRTHAHPNPICQTAELLIRA